MDDETTFNNHYKQYKSYICRLIRRYVADVCTAEDLTQQTFMKAWAFRSTFRGESAYRTWLHQIAINTTFSHLKSRRNRYCKKHGVYIDDEMGDKSDILNEIIAQEESTSLEKALLKMSAKMCDIITLYTVRGMSYENIAKFYNCPVGTVRSRLNYARYSLMKKLNVEPGRNYNATRL